MFSSKSSTVLPLAFRSWTYYVLSWFLYVIYTLQLSFYWNKMTDKHNLKEEVVYLAQSFRSFSPCSTGSEAGTSWKQGWWNGWEDSRGKRTRESSRDLLCMGPPPQSVFSYENKRVNPRMNEYSAPRIQSFLQESLNSVKLTRWTGIC